jgi:hypothetical protein
VVAGGPATTNSNAAHAAGRHKIEAETEIENAPGLTEGAQSRVGPAKPGGGNEQPATGDLFPPPHIQPVGPPTDQVTFEEQRMSSNTSTKVSASTPPADATPTDAATLLSGASPTAIAAGVVTGIATDDPFDPAKLRLPQNFVEMSGAKKLLTTVPVRKPKKHDWFRVHPSLAYRETLGIIEYGEDREHYLVPHHMIDELMDEFATYYVFTAITRQGTVFLMPVRMPGVDGKDNEYWRSLREHAQTAMTTWVNIRANKEIGAYDIRISTASISEPVWPEQSFGQLLSIAFRGRLIDRPDHEIVKTLRGLV